MIAESTGLTVKFPGRRSHRAMFEWTTFLDPFDPSAVQHLQILVAQVFQHPKHAAFIAPIVEGVRIDYHLAVLVNAERLHALLDPLQIRIQQSLGTASGSL